MIHQSGIDLANNKKKPLYIEIYKFRRKIYNLDRIARIFKYYVITLDVPVYEEPCPPLVFRGPELHCCFNVASPFATLAQHLIKNDSMSQFALLNAGPKAILT